MADSSASQKARGAMNKQANQPEQDQNRPAALPDSAHQTIPQIQGLHENQGGTANRLSRVNTATDQVHEQDEDYHAIPRSGLDTHFDVPTMEPVPSYHEVAEGEPMSPISPINVSGTSAPTLPSIAATSTATSADAKMVDSDHAILSSEPAHDDDDSLPPYSETWGEVTQTDSDLGTKAAIASDGRVNIRINQRRRLSNILPATMMMEGKPGKAGEIQRPPSPYIPPSLGGEPGKVPPPSMNVVIMVVGSRGDVQPFVALGKVLVDTYGHRVRLATHPVFQKFVEENGLEFFSIGGDPAELMAFMVKNPGLMPGMESLRAGDVGKRRKGIAEMIRGCWRACFEAGDGLGVAVNDETVEEWMNIDEDGDEMSEEARAAAKSNPFVADVIIANPPSFAHVHCAERLGIPLHIMFTMPWSPTQAFPHPLANIQASNADPKIANYISYVLVETLTWQGLGDIINRFRIHTLGLEPVSLIWAPGVMGRLKIPHTYCWSPTLIRKPADWGPHINVSGFFFLNLASNYTPAADLAAFLDSGPPPVYIGFGSIVVDDPNAMTEMIFEAIKKTGQRALVSKGWGGLGADEMGIPEGVFMLGNVPHDWLFHKVSCVVHHGGAGTTSAGISCGKATVVVPFFGDQPFWGSMVARAGAGPAPIPYKELTADKLADQIKFALQPSTVTKAKEMALQIKTESGTHKGAQSFHQFLKLDRMRCAIFPTKTAVWRVKRTQILLSAVAAYALFDKELITWDDIKLHRVEEFETDLGPPDPVSGTASALVGLISSIGMGVADMPVDVIKRIGGASQDKAYTDIPHTTNSEKSKSKTVFNHHSRSSISVLTGKNSDKGKKKARRDSDESGSASASVTDIGTPTSPASRTPSMTITPVSSIDSSAPMSQLTTVSSPDTISPGIGSIEDRISVTTSNATTEDSNDTITDSTGPERSETMTSPTTVSRTPSGHLLNVPSHEDSLINTDGTVDRGALFNGSQKTTRGRSSSQSSMGEAVRAVSQRGQSPWRQKTTPLCPSRSATPTRENQPQRNHSRNRSVSQQRNLARSAPTFGFDGTVDALDTMYGTGKGVGRIVGAAMKSPMDITMAISKGFSNLSRLYGEEPRQADRVTGVQSGLRVAAKEFGFQLFDGITGIVTEPVKGAKQEGAPGFFKGVGKGVAGLLFKPAAAANALPAYAMMGIYKEIQKRFGENVGGYILAARVAQGYGEWLALDEDAKRESVRSFMEKLSEVRGHRGLGGSGSVGMAREGGIEKMKTWLEEQRQKRQAGKLQKAGLALSKESKKDKEKQEKLTFTVGNSSKHKGGDKGVSGSAASMMAGAAAAQQRNPHKQAEGPAATNLIPVSPRSSMSLEEADSDDEDADIEEAIKLSLRAHNAGYDVEEVGSLTPRQPTARSRERAPVAKLEENARQMSGSSAVIPSHEEDPEFARAVTASLEELKLNHSAQAHDQEALARAVQESIRHQNSQNREFDEYRLRRAPTESAPPSYSRSVTSEGQTPTLLSHHQSRESNVTTGSSLYSGVSDGTAGGAAANDASSLDDDEELRLALEESHKSIREAEEKQRKEEEIVMEFVKKQSLAEEEFRRKRLNGTTNMTGTGEQGQSSGSKR